ncbi:hypothetical protein CXB51_025888 [Gossypium anomalum]|uniref:Reverse transcriptase Ty1/copia-type domain-containing protein n=1 Tax=Gossypium anomalum TaxID=47600 RepID=A0A8J5Y3N2_9ROSI|nr:hypothetical protein CXB51_025888 [Gossypium anomalum]
MTLASQGYFCLTPDGKIIVSRHVVFDENRFLFPISPTSTNASPLNTTTYVPVIRSDVPHTVRSSLVSATEESITHSGHDGTRTQPISPGRAPTTGVSLGSHNCDSVLRDSSATCGASCHCSDNLPDVSGTIVREEAISTPVISSEPVPTTNTHGMITRSKAGIFKPKALCVANVELEPVSIEEALAHPDWRLAVQAEYDALIANSTWELYSLPPGRKAIGCKWLFKIKKNPDGTINRRKARLVAKGCSQVPGCDFTETFSPVVKPATIRVILSVAVTKGWPLRQLKQFLVSTGFIISKSDASLFVRSSPDYTLYVLVYVDDIVITGSSTDGIDCFIQQLHNKFALKDMGDLHYFLGIEVNWSSSGSLHLSQCKYVRELLARASMSTAKSVHTPMVSSSMLSKNDGEYLADPTEYRSLAGALQYIVLTRPDIAYAVNRVCQFMHAPTSLHMVALKRILRYLRGTLSYGLLFRPSKRVSLVGYADANWGLDFDDRRSTTGFYGIMVIHLYLGVPRNSRLSLGQLPRLNIVALLLSLVASGELVVGEVPACDQVADILTKPLSVSIFTRFRNSLQVVPLEEVG